MTAAPVTILPSADAEVFETQRDTILGEAQLCVVDSQETLKAAGAMLTDVVKPLLKEIEKSCDPVCAAANAVHKAACDQRSDLKAPLLEAEKLFKQKMGTWVTAENARVAAEQKRIDDEQAAAEAKRKRLEQDSLARAAEQEAAGKKGQATQTMNRAIERSERPITPPRAAPAAPAKVKGVSMGEVWECEIMDKMAFLQAIVDGKIPKTVLKIEIGVMNRLAQASDGQVDWPGVSVKKVPRVAAGSR